MTLLITGGFGMLGAATVQHLVSDDEEVVVFGRSDHREFFHASDKGFAVELGDIEDSDAIERVLARHRVTRICHFAAALSSAGADSPLLSYRVNVDATVKLVEAARRADIQRFVLISSKAVYAPPTGEYSAPTYRPVPEDYPKAPTRLYGSTKLAAELLVTELARTYGLSTAILRFGTTYGPGKDPNKYLLGSGISALIEAAVRGESATVADSGTKTDFVYVRDVAAGVARAARADLPGVESYNIASGKGLALSEVRDALARITSVDGVELRPAVASPPGRLDMVLDITKAASQLGYRPAWDLDAAIADYFAVCKTAAASVRRRRADA